MVGLNPSHQSYKIRLGMNIELVFCVLMLVFWFSLSILIWISVDLGFRQYWGAEASSLFSRLGCVGVVFSLWASQIRINRDNFWELGRLKITSIQMASEAIDRVKENSLSQSDMLFDHVGDAVANHNTNQKKSLLFLRFEILIAALATLQWGFGDLLMKKLTICGELTC